VRYTHLGTSYPFFELNMSAQKHIKSAILVLKGDPTHRLQPHILEPLIQFLRLIMGSFGTQKRIKSAVLALKRV